MARQVPWLRICAEGIAIVVSILLAFGIQAWWEDRQLTQEVRDDLATVAREVASNRERVRFQLDLTERMAAAGDSMAEILASDPQSRIVELPDTLVWLGAASPGSTLDGSFGALEALISSGRLGSVDDVDLRSRLAALRERFEDAVENQFNMREIGLTRFRPETMHDLDYTLVSGVPAAFWAGERVVGRALVHQGSVSFPNSLGIRNVIGWRNVALSTIRGEMRSLLQEMEWLLERLRVLSVN